MPLQATNEESHERRNIYDIILFELLLRELTLYKKVMSVKCSRQVCQFIPADKCCQIQDIINREVCSTSNGELEI